MRKHTARITFPGWLLTGLAILSCSSCGTDSSRARELPEPGVARRAVETALNSWRDNPWVERTTTSIRPVMFAEQQQPAGQRLLRFKILGETPGYEDEGYRRFLVRLSLAEPDDSVVATYFVFGQDPVWVYRSDDFDMLMHMDKSMMPPPPVVGDASRSEQGEREEAGTAPRVPPPNSKNIVGSDGTP